MPKWVELEMIDITNFEELHPDLLKPRNNLEVHIYLTNWENNAAGKSNIRWDMMERFDTGRATVITFPKRDKILLRILKELQMYYTDDLTFKEDFIDWTMENFKGPWTYSACTVAINLIFKYPEDAVYFRLSWMATDNHDGMVKKND